MTTLNNTIPIELTELIKSCSIFTQKNEWGQICALIQPFPEQHMILSTNTPNNTIILAAKICDLLGINLTEFKMFTPVNDIYDPERNHGIYTHNNKYFYMDMKRIRYDDYKYMIRILESIIYSQRINIDITRDDINTPDKITIIITNFDMVLHQYLVKFIKYTETLSANVTFIYIGSGIINYYSRATKLKGLCIVKQCMFTKLPSCLNYYYTPKGCKILDKRVTGECKRILDSTVSPECNIECNIDAQKLYDTIGCKPLSPPNDIAKDSNYCMQMSLSSMLYNFTDGDVIKSWLILQIFNADECANALLSSLTMMQLFNKYILPNLPILNSIYELLILLRETITNKTYEITPIINKLYILHSYPDMNICRIISMIFKVFAFIHTHDTSHKLYLSQTNIIELNNLCNKFIAMDTITPYIFNESILILRSFITKLLLFFAD
jgi:hypothetical protein